MQIASTSGRSSRSTLTHTKRSFMSARDRPGPRTTRAPSRGTSGRPSSRSRRAADGPRSRARASASSPHGMPVHGVVRVLQQVRRASRPPRRFGIAVRLPQPGLAQYARAPCHRGGSVASTPRVDNGARRTGGGRPIRPRRQAGGTCCSARARSRWTRRPASSSARPRPIRRGRCLENLAAVCDAAGATLGDAVRLHGLPDRHGAFASVNEVYESFFESDPPARVGDRRGRRCRAARWWRSTRWWRSPD